MSHFAVSFGNLAHSSEHNLLLLTVKQSSAFSVAPWCTAHTECARQEAQPLQVRKRIDFNKNRDELCTAGGHSNVVLSENESECTKF